MILIEKRNHQISLIIKKNINNIKKSTNYIFFKIKINKNLLINNFIQINLKKKKKKIFFFPKFFILNNFKMKKNLLFLISNIYIY